MRIKKIGFILLLLTFPMTSIFAQISDQEKRIKEERLGESSKLNFLKTPLKNEIEKERILLLSEDDSIGVMNDTNKSFWSVDLGWKNYKELMTIGLSMGIYILARIGTLFRHQW